MQSIMNLMREVEIKEEAAEQAKEEVSRGGLDILNKVEELKLILPHAKEANDMVVHLLITIFLYFLIIKCISIIFKEKESSAIGIFFFFQHAGDVYGEKAVLATEIRELQNRLLILSEERDKSLSIINEVIWEQVKLVIW